MSYKNIIFLKNISSSNSGAEKITDITYDAWLNFVPRENLILKNFTLHLEEAAYNEKGINLFFMHINDSSAFFY